MGEEWETEVGEEWETEVGEENGRPEHYPNIPASLWLFASTRTSILFEDSYTRYGYPI